MVERPPLILLPGLACDAELWATQAETLRDVAHPHIADLTRQDSVSAMAATVLDHAPDRFALAALSMGGYVAFEIMRQAPDRVTRLALFDTSAAPDEPERQEERRRALRSLETGRFMGVTTRMLPLLVHDDHVHGTVGETVRAMAKRVGAAAFARQQTAILERPDSRPCLGAIKVPTIVVVGADDRMTPLVLAREIHDGIPGSSLHIIPHCGHLPPLEAPETTSQLLRDWLTTR